MSLATEHNQYCQKLTAAMRSEMVPFTASLERLKEIMAAEIDASCECDTCNEFSVAIDRGDALLKQLRDLIGWLEVPARDDPADG